MYGYEGVLIFVPAFAAVYLSICAWIGCFVTASLNDQDVSGNSLTPSSLRPSVPAGAGVFVDGGAGGEGRSEGAEAEQAQRGAAGQ